VCPSRGRSWDDGQQELDGTVAGNAGKSAREQLTLIRIFEELRERGYDRRVRRSADGTPGAGARSADNPRARGPYVP